MSQPNTTVMARESDRLIRVVLPGIGAVDIETGLTDAAGNPVVRIDVQSDADRGQLAYGLNPDGIPYEVKNGDPGPGVVFLVGRPTTAPPTDAETARMMQAERVSGSPVQPR